MSNIILMNYCTSGGKIKKNVGVSVWKHSYKMTNKIWTIMMTSTIHDINNYKYLTKWVVESDNSWLVANYISKIGIMIVSNQQRHQTHRLTQELTLSLQICSTPKLPPREFRYKYILWNASRFCSIIWTFQFTFFF